jgi:predicted unusual protein kinase regulating ubiquinone biosynthesis (AarF/ABC1/UbiB family)
MDDRRKPPPGAVRRSVKLASTLGGQGARIGGTRVANVGRSEERAAALLERRHLEAAERIADMLGSMKGGAMKVGQLASFVDVALVPLAYRPLYQERLAALRDAAPAMSWDPIRQVIEEELGTDAFAEIEREPAAAASIGQVHRATLHDGRRVAVKVQYPGIARALEADVRSASVLLPLARAVAPGLDPRPLAAELRERLLEELDYELEAQAQRAFARHYRDHPWAHVPAPVTELCRARVLVTEWVDGLPFERVRELGQAERDRFGEIVDRFYWGSLHELNRVNADPHPGNYLLMDDARVAFLDFGSTRTFTAQQVESQIGMMRAAAEGDADALVGALRQLGYLRRDAPEPERLLAYMRRMAAYVLTDAEVMLDPEELAQRMADVSDPRTEEFRIARRLNVPGEYLMLHRIDVGMQAVLAQLGANRNWHRIAREWWYGDEPSTELGRQAAAWSRAAAGQSPARRVVK